MNKEPTFIELTNIFTNQQEKHKQSNGKISPPKKDMNRYFLKWNMSGLHSIRVIQSMNQENRNEVHSLNLFLFQQTVKN